MYGGLCFWKLQTFSGFAAESDFLVWSGYFFRGCCSVLSLFLLSVNVVTDLRLETWRQGTQIAFTCIFCRWGYSYCDLQCLVYSLFITSGLGPTSVQEVVPASFKLNFLQIPWGMLWKAPNIISLCGPSRHGISSTGTYGIDSENQWQTHCSPEPPSPQHWLVNKCRQCIWETLPPKHGMQIVRFTQYVSEDHGMKHPEMKKKKHWRWKKNYISWKWSLKLPELSRNYIFRG